MKRLLLSLILFVYVSSSLGMSVKLHYCCGELDGISFLSKNANNCDKDHAKNQGSCCSHQVISAKLNLDQQAASAIYLEKNTEESLATSTYLSLPAQSGQPFGQKEVLPVVPPLPVPLYIYFGVFRI